MKNYALCGMTLHSNYSSFLYYFVLYFKVFLETSAKSLFINDCTNNFYTKTDGCLMLIVDLTFEMLAKLYRMKTLAKF